MTLTDAIKAARGDTPDLDPLRSIDRLDKDQAVQGCLPVTAGLIRYSIGDAPAYEQFVPVLMLRLLIAGADTDDLRDVAAAGRYSAEGGPPLDVLVRANRAIERLAAWADRTQPAPSLSPTHS